MPCHDGREDCDRENQILIKLEHSNSNNHELATALTNAQSEIYKLMARNDELAQLLCAVGRARQNKTEIPMSVLYWWQTHCKMDAERGEPW